MEHSELKEKEIVLNKVVAHLKLLVKFINKAQSEVPQSLTDKQQIKAILLQIEEKADMISKILPL